MADKFKACSVDGCNDNATWSASGRGGYCQKHYKRLRKNGDPLQLKKAESGSALAYFRSVVLGYEGDDCLFWPHERDKDGYGRLFKDGKHFYVHRRVCEEVNGPAPSPRHQAAHSCGKGHLGCVTKQHVLWKTPKENQADRIRHGTSCRGA